MSSRISIKGKGAELFFGGAEVLESPSSRDETSARKTDSVLAGKTDSKKASMPESKTARHTEVAPGEPRSSAVLRTLREALLEEHPVNNSFRYSQESLDAVRDIAYELEVMRNLKTSRNDIMRLGLAWIIDDYRAKGADSVLVAVLKEERGRASR
ncbi:MAG: hypothetical protein IVW36_03880 [Dehalococcoidia bacterium]|nr:hypothetical protein [Dehalococcoidia bacterium]